MGGLWKGWGGRGAEVVLSPGGLAWKCSRE